MANLNEVSSRYEKLFGKAPLLVRSPGRINLIGEHTDYNLGCVLPAATDKCIYLALGSRTDQTIELVSADFDYTFTAALNTLEPAWKLWPNYILGVINEFKNLGRQIYGVNIVFGGNIPLSAGMSSSAAICSGTAYALNKLFGWGLSKLELAKIAVSAEHNYLGVKCGLMDPYVNLFGKEGNLVKLNCKTEEHEYIPFKADGVRIVLLDTGIRHNFIKLSEAFNALRLECQNGLEIIQKHAPHITCLPEVKQEMLDQLVKPENEIAYKRCLYIVQETERLENVCQDLKNNNFRAVGKRLFESHEGLKNLYEISCDECDFLVDLAKQMPAVLGARMMGAGFGGCTINLIESDAVEEVIETAKLRYKERFDRQLKVYHTSIGNGTEEVTID